VTISPFTRRGVAVLASVLLLTGVGLASGGSPAAAADQTVCHDASLPQQRTEVDADLSVPQFDPSLGTLLAVSVPSQTAELATDAQFQNVAQTSVVFSETMQYTLTFTSPGGLASPPALVGTIQRIPSTTLAPFSGTQNFQGPSSVSEPSTTRDSSASPVSSSDPSVLAAFTGSGTVAFHVQSSIAEVFNGGGGNVAAVIDTYVAASTQVCYTYAAPEVAATPPVTAAAPPPPARPPAPEVTSPQFTG
jgi:hypothetical protein